MFNIQNYSKQNIKNDVLSGALVAVALVPEAIAFSFIAGVSPVVGLYGAFIIGLITAVLGGKPGMISKLRIFYISNYYDKISRIYYSVRNSVV